MSGAQYPACLDLRQKSVVFARVVLLSAPLTVRTKEGGTAALDDLADRLAAGVAGLADAAVDRQFELEIASLAADLEEVGDGGAAGGNGCAQHAGDGPAQGAPLGGGQGGARRGGMDAGLKQAFTGVDVAHPHHHPAVQQQFLDGAP